MPNRSVDRRCPSFLTIAAGPPGASPRRVNLGPGGTAVVRRGTGECARWAHDCGDPVDQTRSQYRSSNFARQREMSMAPTGAALEGKKTTVEDNARCTEMTTARNLVRHIHHHAYACWDSEETRHFYEDILGMPLIATAVVEDSLRSDGASYCLTFFEIADGNTLAFSEHTSLVHPKYVNARSGCHRHVAFEVEGDA